MKAELLVEVVVLLVSLLVEPIWERLHQAVWPAIAAVLYELVLSGLVSMAVIALKLREEWVLPTCNAL
jgi:hypothetical protein